MRDRFVKQLEQTVLPGRLGESRGTAVGGQVQVGEVHVDLRGRIFRFRKVRLRGALP